MATVLSIVSYPFLPAKVGGQKGVALFNKYFSRYREMVCVTTKKNDPTAAEGYKVLNILSNSPLRYINPFYYFKMGSLIRKYKASHLIIEHPYYGWLGTLLAVTFPVKFVVHSHNIEGLRWKTLGKWWWPVLLFYEKWTHRMADYSFFIHNDDREYAIHEFGLDPARCLTVTYGIEWNSIPPESEILSARKAIRSQFLISEDEKILFFNGAFNYAPNIDALKKIIEEINPLLMKKDFKYRIIICGRDIPVSLTRNKDNHIIFAGFVDDIGLYFKGADVFINPVTEGGGIKTKLVEALGYNLNAVSTVNGALGIDPVLCNGKLLLCQDHDWQAFANLVVKAAKVHSNISPGYYDHFYWGLSAKKAAAFIDP